MPGLNVSTNVIKVITMIVINFVTPKVGAKLEFILLRMVVR